MAQRTLAEIRTDIIAARRIVRSDIQEAIESCSTLLEAEDVVHTLISPINGANMYDGTKTADDIERIVLDDLPSYKEWA